MRPRLEPIFLPDRRREAGTPPVARVVLDHVLDGCFADEGSVETYVVFFAGRGGGRVSFCVFCCLFMKVHEKQ